MEKSLKICTIGGGTGMPVVNKALVKAGFRNVSSIVTTFDSGGDTGRLRTDERGRILAYSDYWRSLISLWVDGEQKELWEEMLRYRDGRSRNFGNLFFQFMTEKLGDLSDVGDYFAKLMNADMRGTVIPVTLTPSEMCFRTKSGREFCGEHRLDEMRMSADMVEVVWLQDKVRANEKAIKAIKEADYLIICPGSLYGSVIINFLPVGMKEAYQQSNAKKYLITNIMSVANENHGYDQESYLEIMEKYLGVNSLDLIIMADLKCLDRKNLKRALYSYELERSFPISYKNNCRIKTVKADIALIEKGHGRLRHSEKKLSDYLAMLLLK
ncbi:2-phospho-L-lactate transferase CofD family protein [Patescibacteria group bacterium]|nr:2-phospho-L-lactate transferase CofD family protein [Patescibacteria group bacterium]